MESKENLYKIRFYYNNCAEDSPTPGELEWFNSVEKDLDRLEKYDKAKELIKKKKVDVTDILDVSKRYVKELWTLVYNKHHPNELTQEQFDFILEVFR